MEGGSPRSSNSLTADSCEDRSARTSNPVRPRPKMTPRLTGQRRSSPQRFVSAEAEIQKTHAAESVPPKLRHSTPMPAAPSPAPVFQLMPRDIDQFASVVAPLLEASSTSAMARLLEAMELRLHEHSSAIQQTLLDYFGESRMKWSECQAADTAKPEGVASQALEAQPAPAPAPAECGCSTRVMEALEEVKQLAITAAAKAEHARVETPILPDISLTVNGQKTSQQGARITGRTMSRRASGGRDKPGSRSNATGSRPSNAMGSLLSRGSEATEVWDSDRLGDVGTDSEESSHVEEKNEPKRDFAKRAINWMGHKLDGVPTYSFAAQISASTWFRMVSFMMTFLNCIVIAIDVDDTTDKTLLKLQGVSVQRSQAMVNGMQGFQICFIFWMVCELGVKLQASGARFFSAGDVAWNLLDLFVLVISVVDLFFTELSLSFVRVLRIFKGLKAIQAIRFMRYNFALRKMASMIWHVASTCLLAMLLLFFLLYIVGLIIMAGVTVWAPAAVDHERRLALVGYDYNASTAFALPQGSVVEDLRSQYGNFGRTLLTLLRGISGADWGAFAAPVAKLSWFLGFVWVVYILLVLVGFFQFLTAIMVDQFQKPSAIEGTIKQLQEDKEAKALKGVISRELAKCGRNETSQLSSKFIMKFILREDVSKQLRTVGINIDRHTYRDWVQAIDKRGEGSILAQDLARALFRLRGEALSLDVNTLRAELRHVEVVLDDLFDVVRDMQDKLQLMGMPVGL